MDSADLIPSLSLLTMIIVVLAAAIGLALFLRKRRNRHPVETQPGPTMAPHEGPPRDRGRI
jgi:hypothetical protein